MKKAKIMITIFLSYFLAFCVCDFVCGKSEGVDKLGFRMFVDEKGIPISDYGSPNGVYVGKQRSITAVAEKGLDYWNKYLLGAKEDKVLLSYDWDKYPENKEGLPKDLSEARTMFFNCANWLLEHVKERENYAVWEYSYPFVTYDIKSGWRSSQAQASSIQLLLRAYKISGEDRYLRCAKAALQAFYVPVEDGGLTDKSSAGWWYDKFADKGCKCPKVLNGMMFALLGIHDFYDRTGDKDAKFLFDKGIIALKDSVSKYDTGDWSCYDRFGRLASPKYHNIHVRQLEILYDITKEEIFREYHEKFRKYSSE